MGRIPRTPQRSNPTLHFYPLSGNSSKKIARVPQRYRISESLQSENATCKESQYTLVGPNYVYRKTQVQTQSRQLWRHLDTADPLLAINTQHHREKGHREIGKGNGVWIAIRLLLCQQFHPKADTQTHDYKEFIAWIETVQMAQLAATIDNQERICQRADCL